MSGGPPWLVAHHPVQSILPAPSDRTYPIGTVMAWCSRGWRVHLDGYRWPACAVVLEAPRNGQHGRLLCGRGTTVIGRLLNSGRGISLAAHRDLEQAGFRVLP